MEDYQKISDQIKKITKLSKKDSPSNAPIKVNKPKDLSFIKKLSTVKQPKPEVNPLSIYIPPTREIPIKDSPEQIAQKLNTLSEAVDASVIRGLPTTKDVVEELKNLTGNDRIDISNIRNGEQLSRIAQRIDMNDMRWHGAGISSVTHDSSLTGSGTPADPLKVAGGTAGDVNGPASSTDNALTRYDGTTGKLIQNSTVTLDDSGNIASPLSIQMGNGSAVTLAAGKMWYNNLNGTWNMGMGGGNITQQVGEEMFIYGKASEAITDSPLQIVYKTGSVGASGVLQFAPTISGIIESDLILGVATEPLLKNAFGRITTFGIVHGITTDGTAYGETWADNDDIWYNPVTGNPTKVKPSAPNIKVKVGTVINAGSGGSGSFFCLLGGSSELGGTDSNVQFGTISNGQIMTYDGANTYWTNSSLTAGTGISVGTSTHGVLTVTNSAPDQTVALTAGTGISVTGTYPNFTITNSASSFAWTAITADQTAAVNTGYLANKGSLLTLALPSSSAVGTTVRVAGMNAGLWKISQAAGQYIKFGNQATTTGATGYLASVLTYDAVELVCIEADKGWVVASSIGNITVA